MNDMKWSLKKNFLYKLIQVTNIKKFYYKNFKAEHN